MEGDIFGLHIQSTYSTLVEARARASVVNQFITSGVSAIGSLGHYQAYRSYATGVVLHLKGNKDPDASFRHLGKKTRFAFLHMPPWRQWLPHIISKY